MSAQDSLTRLGVQDPTAAAAVVDALWAELARDNPKMFAALWRRANQRSSRPERLALPVTVPVEWIEEEPVVRPAAIDLDLSAAPAPLAGVPTQPGSAPLMIELPSSLDELLPTADRARY